MIQKEAVKILTKKRYNAIPAAGAGEVGEILEPDLATPAPDWVKKLGPADARWVMVVVLADARSKITFGSTASVELNAYLFDKNTGELLWKSQAVGKSGQGGLIGMAMKGSNESMAVAAATSKLFKTLQGGPESGKKNAKNARPKAEPAASDAVAAAAAPKPPAAAEALTIAPDRPRVDSLKQVQRIFIEKMANDFDQHLRIEIGRQLSGRIQVVQRSEDADAVLTGSGSQSSGASALTGRIGLSDSASGSVFLVARGSGVDLWSSSAGDRSKLGTMTGIGMVKGRGPSKVAQRLIADLASALKE